MPIQNRISLDDYFCQMSDLVKDRGTCSRRKVGCVLVDFHHHVVATGYNGVASGQRHCIDHPCAGASCKSGEGLELCEAIHAEQNALLQCKDVHEIEVCYCTTAPCVTCTKLLLNTSCQKIVFTEDYPQAKASKALWENSGRIWARRKPHKSPTIVEATPSTPTPTETISFRSTWGYTTRDGFYECWHGGFDSASAADEAHNKHCLAQIDAEKLRQAFPVGSPTCYFNSGPRGAI